MYLCHMEQWPALLPIIWILLDVFQKLRQHNLFPADVIYSTSMVVAKSTATALLSQ